MAYGSLPRLGVSHRRRTGVSNPTIKRPHCIMFFFAFLLASATLWGGIFAVTAKMPLEEIEVGMRGTGVTVFEGTTREEFTADVLGVLTNVMGPRRNLIVARLSGGPLGQTGVIQGMSGSPVYLDGKLAGAIAYSFPFSTEPITGIRPIHEMVERLDDAPPDSARFRSPREIRMADAGGALRFLPDPEANLLPAGPRPLEGEPRLLPNKPVVEASWLIDCERPNYRGL